MAPRRLRQCPRRRFLLFACSLSASSTERPSQLLSTLFCLRQHESLAFGSRSCPSPSAATNRLANQTTVGFTPHACTQRLSRLRFPFHEGEEIGPRMLARVAKHTGLTPNDL